MLEKFIEFSKPTTIANKGYHQESKKFRLPEELSFLLEKYPHASLLNRFFFIVNPIVYADVLNEIYIPLNTPSTCFARDAFGSLYVWENESIKIVNVRYGMSEIVGRKPSVFFNLKMTDEGFLKKRLQFDKFIEAKERLGELAYDECYGYVPILAAGGPEKVENLQKLKLREHILIISQLAGKIE